MPPDRAILPLCSPLNSGITNPANAGAPACVELGICPAMDSGEIRLRQLGYKQELRRNFTLLSNASIGFTAISILTGITGKPQPHTEARVRPAWRACAAVPFMHEQAFTCMHQEPCS